MCAWGCVGEGLVHLVVRASGAVGPWTHHTRPCAASAHVCCLRPCHALTPPPRATQAYSARTTWVDNLEYASFMHDRPAPLRPGDVLQVLVIFCQYLGIIATLPVPWPVSELG